MTRRNLAGHAKISVKKARKFLENFANSSDADIPYFENLSGQVFEPEVPKEAVRMWMLNIEAGDPPRLSKKAMIRRYWLIPLRNAIRTVWSLPDLRSKQFAVHEILKQFLLRGDRRFRFTPMGESYSDAFSDSLGPLSPLERILNELAAERSHQLAHVCGNSKCSSPYFFATRRSQKYCTEGCAAPAQREAKLKWWNAIGKNSRSKRRGAGKQRVIKKSERTPAGRGNGGFWQGGMPQD
jgi:hypothetical protein